MSDQTNPFLKPKKQDFDSEYDRHLNYTQHENSFNTNATTSDLFRNPVSNLKKPAI